MTELGKAIARARKAQGLSTEDVAQRAALGTLTARAIHRIEHGKEAPGLDELAAIAAALGTTTGQLRASIATLPPLVESPPAPTWPPSPPPTEAPTMQHDEHTAHNGSSTPTPTGNAIPGVDDLARLVAQRDQLDKAIEELRAAQRAKIVASIREAVGIYSIAITEIFDSTRLKPGRKPGQQYPRNGAQGGAR